MNKHELKSLLENIYRALTEQSLLPPAEPWHPPLLPPDDEWHPPMLPPKPPVTPTITPYDPVVLDPSSIPNLLRDFDFPITIPESITNEGLRDWFRTLGPIDWVRIWGWYNLHIRPNLTPDMQKQVDDWVRQLR